MRRSWIACGLALLAGCSRDLSVPSERTLAVAPTFAPAAPRERVALTATGGVAPYTAGFAQGGRLSGGDATVVPAGPPGTFAYHAGSLGSAQDLVEVRDASGAAVTMRVSVGPRLRVTPTLAVTAPGGQVAVVASGGLKPYTFTLEDAQPGTTLTPGPGADEYVITVGTLGDRAERAVLRDATFEPAFPGSSASAEAIVQVSGGVRLYANAPSVVPPFETVDFLAVGGLPPYTFGFAGGAAPSGGVIDPVSGRYVAGAVGAADGSVWDGIVATDALGQVSASWPIAVGAPLRLELPATGLSPGIPQQLVASGGKPPYTFGFAARGNRSAGNVNAASGIYTPGSNQGTADLLAVWDATGVGSFVLSEPLPVGFSEIEIGAATGRVIEARLRGDRRPDNDAPRHDALLTHYDGALSAGLTAVFMPPGLPPWLANGNVAQLNGLTFAADLDGDGHDEVVGLGPAGLAVLEPDLFGNLTLARAEGPAISRATRSPLPASPVTFYTGTGCTCVGASAGTTWPQFACAAAGSGVYRVEFAGSTVPRWTCDLLPAAAATLVQTSTGLAAGDFDGDGEVDLAWVNTAPNVVSVSYRIGGTLAAAAAQGASLPPSCNVFGSGVYQSDGKLVSYQRLADATDTKSFLVASLLCQDTSPARQKVARVDGGSPGSRFPFLAPAGAVDLGRPVSGTASLRVTAASTGAAQHVAVFAGGVYDIHGVSFDAAGVPTVFTALGRPLPSSMQWIALPDVDGDEVPDLLVAGTNQIARFLLGDGDGRFGVRVRFQHQRSWAFGDLDGDGLDDVAALDNSPALTVGFGGGHQLGWAPSRAVPGGGAALAVGQFGRGPEIVHSEFIGGAAWRTRLNADGTLQAPERVVATVPNIRVLKARSFASGADGAMDFWSNSYGLGVLLFENPADLLAARWVQAPFVGANACVYYPVGDGSAAFPVEAVALCNDLASPSALTLYRSSLTAGPSGVFSAWTALTGAGLPASAAGLVPEILGAGTLDDGSAWFVATPSGTDGVRHRYAVRIAPAPSDPHANPVVTVIDLGLASAVGAVKAALVGDLDGAVDGRPEILLLGGGKLSVYAWGGGTSATRVRQVGAAGVSIDGIVKLAPGTSRDVVLTAADDGVIVRNAGGVLLQ